MPHPYSLSGGTLYQHKQGQKPPSNAVLLSDSEVLELSQRIIKKYDNSSDVFALRYGMLAIGSSATISSYYINQVFRDALRIPLRVGFVASYLPAVFLASCSAALTHQSLVQNPVILGRLPCSVCAELRGGTAQVAMSIVYPLLMCPMSSLFLARRYNTYPLTPQGIRVFPLLRSLVKPKSRILWLLTISQFALGMFIANQESYEARRMWLKYANELEDSSLSSDDFHSETSN